MLPQDRLDAVGITHNITPLPGWVMVYVPSLYEHVRDIVIPEVAAAARNYEGVVIRANLAPKDRRTLAADLAPGERVVLANHGGRRVTRTEPVYLYPADQILAKLDDGVAVAPSTPEVERCRWCGSCRDGSTNAMMLWDGICPRCRKDRVGKVHPEDEIADVSDAEVERFMEAVGQG